MPQRPMQGDARPPAQEGAFDPAMIPRQVDAPNLEGWDPGGMYARGGAAWAAIVLAGWMALVRLAQGLLALLGARVGGSSSGMLLGGGIVSLVAAGFYVWATIGLYKRNPASYRAVMRVNAFLAVLGGGGIALSLASTGLGIGTIVNIVGVVFHLIALFVTYAARDNLGYEWRT